MYNIICWVHLKGLSTRSELWKFLGARRSLLNTFVEQKEERYQSLIIIQPLRNDISSERKTKWNKQNEDSLIPLENQYLHSQISEQILMWLFQRLQQNDHDSRAKYPWISKRNEAISEISELWATQNSVSFCFRETKLFVLQSFQIKSNIILFTKWRLSNSSKLNSQIEPFPPKTWDYTWLFQLSLLFQRNFLTSNEIASMFSPSCIICISLKDLSISQKFHMHM